MTHMTFQTSSWKKEYCFIILLFLLYIHASTSMQLLLLAFLHSPRYYRYDDSTAAISTTSTCTCGTSRIRGQRYCPHFCTCCRGIQDARSDEDGNSMSDSLWSSRRSTNNNNNNKYNFQERRQEDDEEEEQQEQQEGSRWRGVLHSISIPYNTTNHTSNSSINTTTITDEEYIQNYIDEHFMGLALEEAKEAGYSHDEVPIGAIVVIPSTNKSSGIPTTTTGPNQDDTSLSHPEKILTTRHFEILSKGQNQIETQYDASAHAEMQALRMASRTIQNWRLLNATLYTTLEPCPMCLSAAQAFRVSRIVYGAPDLRLGAVETYMKLLDYPHPFHGSDAMEVVGGVKCEEARMLLVDFFRQRRMKSKE